MIFGWLRENVVFIRVWGVLGSDNGWFGVIFDGVKMVKTLILKGSLELLIELILGDFMSIGIIRNKIYKWRVSGIDRGHFSKKIWSNNVNIAPLYVWH